MIEGSAGPPTPPGAPRRPSPGGRWVARLRGGLGTFREWTLPPRRQRAVTDLFLWRLQLAQRLFWIALAGLGCYIVIDLFLIQRPLPTLSQPGRGAQGAGAPSTASVVHDRIKPLSEYRELLVGRNPFGLKAREEEGATAVQWVKDKLIELSSNLALVGISRGKNPEAIIEDKAAQRTLFIKVGDVVNGLTVKAIDAQGVLVTYEGQELYLK